MSRRGPAPAAVERVARLSGWLVERDGRDLAGARLPAARSRPHALRRVAGDPALPRAVDRADQAAHPRRTGQLRSRAVGVPARAAGDADPAHLHPAGRHHRRVQPALPDLLHRLLARADRGRAPLADVLASLDTRLSPGERAHRRADALRRRTDALPAPGRTAAPRSRPRNIVRVLVNTNGVRIARDDALLDLLTEHRERVEVYLQYDGASAEAQPAPPRRRPARAQGAGRSTGSPPGASSPPSP